MSNVNAQRSEVARLLDQIREEYEAAMRGLSGLAQGTSRHSFITTRMENMGKLQTQLDELVGDNAIALVVTCLENCTDYSSSTQTNGAQPS
jgi:hypothetical protein